MPGQKRQSVYPFSDQNGAKTLHDGAAHTHMAYTMKYPSPPTPAPLPFTTCATNTVSKGAVISKANTFFASIENFFRID